MEARCASCGVEQAVCFPSGPIAGVGTEAHPESRAVGAAEGSATRGEGEKGSPAFAATFESASWR